MNWPWSRKTEPVEVTRETVCHDLEWVFVDGFEGHVPSEKEIAFLLSDPDMKRRKRDVGISTGGLPGRAPTTPEELATVAGALAMTKGSSKLGHDIDLDKITYEVHRGLLVLKVWR